MSEQDENHSKGPSLGGPNLSGPNSGPSLGEPSLGGPSTGPNSSGPNLGTTSSGPKLGSTSFPAKETKPLSHNEKPESSKKKTANLSELNRRWRVQLKQVLQSLQTLMSFEYKTKVTITPFNLIYRDFIKFIINGQYQYFNEMKEWIIAGKDPLTKKLRKKNKNAQTSIQVYETLEEIIKAEMERFDEDRPDIMSELQDVLKLHKDARAEPRFGFWIIFTAALQLKLINEKHPKELEIILNVLIRYKPALKRTLGVLVHFCYHLIYEFSPYEVDMNRIKLVVTQSGTGYNMASWIKYRYGTDSQSYMEYERFISYFLKSFGKVPGNAADLKDGPKEGYLAWINRTLIALESSLRKSRLIVDNARGDTLEGMLVGLKEELENELKDREFDANGKLTNYPIGGDGAVEFLDWLFNLAFHRNKMSSFYSIKQSRVNLSMFDFMEDTIRWVNEYGERISVDWLEGEEAEDIIEDIPELS